MVAAEDYTGASPVQDAGPALPRATTWTRSRPTGSTPTSTTSTPAAASRPTHLGVLSHYDAVIWYTGDDNVTRERRPGRRQRRPAGDGRDARVPRVPQRGRPGALHRRRAGQQYAGADVGKQLYDPKGEIACDPLPAGVDARRCLALRGSRRRRQRRAPVLVRRVHLATPATGTTANGEHVRRLGHRRPVRGSRRGASTAPDGADNQNDSTSFIATSGILPPDEFPQFESWPSAGRTSRAGRSRRTPATSTSTRRSPTSRYKRLTRTIAGAGGWRAT